MKTKRRSHIEIPRRTPGVTAPSAGTGDLSARAPRRCAIREGPQREFSPSVAGERARLIVMNGPKWVNGTVLRYSFFPNQAPFKAWSGSTALKEQVRKAFQRWAAVGIGLRFEEVEDLGQAQVRIGFLANDGHWSYVGREILSQGPDDRTLNLDPTDRIESGSYGIDVACHEIGHTMGFPHEHQNPNAGIVWNEEAVYRALAAPPNNWSRQMTYRNIISKIPADQVRGSSWDPNSVMHYPFEPGLILQPAQYAATGITPAGGISALDKEWVKSFYPALTPADYKTLDLLTSEHLSIGAGEQRNFLLKPKVTRYYEMRTFGTSDTVMVLYERGSNRSEVYLTADDDSGEDRNAYIRRRLHAGRVYVMRLRLYYASDSAETGVMWW